MAANPLTGILSAGGAIASGIGIAIKWFLFLSPVIVGVGFVIFMRSYKHSITLRYKTKGDTDKIITTKFKIQRKKGDPEHIKTLKQRLELPIPPTEAIDIMSNGAWYVEGYVTEGGEVTWLNVDSKRILDKVEVEVPVKTPDGKTQKIKSFSTVEKISDIKLTRLSTQDKAFYYNRLKMANDKYRVNGFWDFVNRNAGVIGLVMVVFVIFLFWGDLMEPAIQAKETDLKRLEVERELVTKLDSIINQRTTIPDAPTANVSAPEFRGPE